MPRLILVRHGRAAAGWGADLDPGLDELGRTQAENVAKVLAPQGPLPIVTSPLRRCQETAAPLAALWQNAATLVLSSNLPAKGRRKMAWFAGSPSGIGVP